MRLRVFGSGSKGNSLAFRCGAGLFLVDIGLSCLDLTRRMAACGLTPGEIRGVFFTHDHSDHWAGLGTFHKKFPDVPLYANGDTADAIAAETGVEDGWRVFETAESFAVDSLSVTTFSVPHDAADPVGYLFEENGKSLFVSTDLGKFTLPAGEALARAHCAVLESNYDPELLEGSDRPVSLKQRIRGPSGHLSNDQAADAVRGLGLKSLQVLLLAHISQQCNADYLAVEGMESALRDIGRADVVLRALKQNEPSELYEF